MIKEIQLRALPSQTYNEQALKKTVARQFGLDERTITAVRVLKKSIDARQHDIYVNVSLRLFVNEIPTLEEYRTTLYPNVEKGKRVIVVGAGPSGLFSALRLIELGYKPVIVERGKNVRDRKIDIASITKTHKINPESNYCFGEGGAGAYSDGKLYTRSRKRGDTDKIMNVLCQHGASAAILFDSHPHIGTDKLPGIIENIRGSILKYGGEILFETRMTGLIRSRNKIVGIKTLFQDSEAEIFGPVILATGHSARDVYRYLHAENIHLQAKSIAVGCRLEHPSYIIDRIMYHNKKGKGEYLPAAEYNYVTQIEGRGVYSFCMCPGGFVVPAASGNEQIVVNGMSASGRNSKWSNAGIVVETRVEDVILSDSDMANPLVMMEFQEKLENECWLRGNKRQTAPAQKMEDFINNTQSYDLPVSSYAPGLVSSSLRSWIPEFISERLAQGLSEFGKKSPGFLTDQAALIGVETRTSAPVRITRNKDTFQNIGIEGLFPCGEGAGYAGGIVSAAIDGENCAKAVANYVESIK